MAIVYITQFRQKMLYYILHINILFMDYVFRGRTCYNLENVYCKVVHNLQQSNSSRYGARGRVSNVSISPLGVGFGLDSAASETSCRFFFSLLRVQKKPGYYK